MSTKMPPIPAPGDEVTADDQLRFGKSAQEVLNVRSAVTADRTRTARWIDEIGVVLSRPALMFVLLAAHVLWILLNLPLWPFEPWDPYPFVFLATVASVEAPFIALLVLMHQQRNSRIAELRDEVDLQVSLHVEREVAMALRLLLELQEAQGIVSSQDNETLERMQQEISARDMVEQIRNRLAEIEGGEGDISA